MMDVRDTIEDRKVGAANATIRVLVAAPQLMLRQALAAVLASAPHVRVLPDVGSARDAVRNALALHPDVVLLDEHLRDHHGVPLADLLLEADPSLRLVALIDDDPDEERAAPDTPGAPAARLSKGLSTDELVAVVRRVAAGERPGDLHARRHLPLRRPELPGDGITGAERTVLALLADGATNRELADSLGCSEKTVRNRLSEIYGKLGLHNRTQAALYALRTGIVAFSQDA